MPSSPLETGETYRYLGKIRCHPATVPSPEIVSWPVSRWQPQKVLHREQFNRQTCVRYLRPFVKKEGARTTTVSTVCYTV